MRVVVIGAGFSGIYLGVRIPQRLRNIDLVIYEKNDDVGGTWYENRYPGCACDVSCKFALPSGYRILKGEGGGVAHSDYIAHSYQYTFAPNPAWRRVYARGPEIRHCLKSVVKRNSVDRFMKLSHQVLDVEWHEDVSKWYVADALRLSISVNS
jgi:cation diffusion facilitator CzcD-associated flavoprotein CzcO